MFICLAIELKLGSHLSMQTKVRITSNARDDRVVWTSIEALESTINIGETARGFPSLLAKTMIWDMSARQVTDHWHQNCTSNHI